MSVNDCGKAINKRAVYWLAAKMAYKASEVDASIKKLALKQPEAMKEELHPKPKFLQRAIKGPLSQFDCWIKSSVKVPDL